MQIKRVISICVVYFTILSLIGCEAFVRKFTRKPKKEDIVQEEMVLSPQEYKSNVTKEELYRKYLLYWKSWQDELIEALMQMKSHKKQVDCIEEAIKNLVNLREMLNAQEQKRLDVYLGRMRGLKDSIVQDTYGTDSRSYIQAAERLKMDILRDFSYNKVKDYLS